MLANCWLRARDSGLGIGRDAIPYYNVYIKK
jgi:hypothetical protein